MNMPGFTAEASLYKTSEIYQKQSTKTIPAGVILSQSGEICTCFYPCFPVNGYFFCREQCFCIPPVPVPPFPPFPPVPPFPLALRPV